MRGTDVACLAATRVQDPVAARRSRLPKALRPRLPRLQPAGQGIAGWNRDLRAQANVRKGAALRPPRTDPSESLPSLDRRPCGAAVAEDNLPLVVDLDRLGPVVPEHQQGNILRRNEKAPAGTGNRPWSARQRPGAQEEDPADRRAQPNGEHRPAPHPRPQYNNEGRLVMRSGGLVGRDRGEYPV